MKKKPYAFVSVGLEYLKKSRNKGSSNHFELDCLWVSQLDSLINLEVSAEVSIILVNGQ